MSELLQRIQEMGVVPVVVLNDSKDAMPLAKALCEGGLPCAEVTFRTDAAEESIRIMAKQFPDMLIGAGTVLTIDQVDRAVSAGAKFIVMPGFNEEVVRWCMDKEICIMPGCVTPTEIMAATALGCRIIKFFPANIYGGLSAIKALSGPFGSARFVPTGGVDGQNMNEFLASPSVFAVGGSWLCASKWIRNHEFSEITRCCKEATACAEAAGRGV